MLVPNALAVHKKQKSQLISAYLGEKEIVDRETIVSVMVDADNYETYSSQSGFVYSWDLSIVTDPSESFR